MVGTELRLYLKTTTRQLLHKGFLAGITYMMPRLLNEHEDLHSPDEPSKECRGRQPLEKKADANFDPDDGDEVERLRDEVEKKAVGSVSCVWKVGNMTSGTIVYFWNNEHPPANDRSYELVSRFRRILKTSATRHCCYHKSIIPANGLDHDASYPHSCADREKGHRCNRPNGNEKVCAHC